MSFSFAPSVPYRPSQCPNCKLLVGADRCKGFVKTDPLGDMLGMLEGESDEPCPKFSPSIIPHETKKDGSADPIEKQSVSRDASQEVVAPKISQGTIPSSSVEEFKTTRSEAKQKETKKLRSIRIFPFLGGLVGFVISEAQGGGFLGTLIYAGIGGAVGAIIEMIIFSSRNSNSGKE